MNNFKIIESSDIHDFQRFVQDYIKDKELVSLSCSAHSTDITKLYYKAFIVTKENGGD